MDAGDNAGDPTTQAEVGKARPEHTFAPTAAKEPAAVGKITQPTRGDEVEESLRKLAEHNLSSVASEFLTADEWGVFTGENGKKLKLQLLANLREAKKALAQKDMNGCDQNVIEARTALNEAQSSRWLWFLANTRFGFLPLLFTLISGVAAYCFVFVGFLKLSVAECIHHPAFLGFSGALLKSLYWLQFQTNKGLLRPRWFAYFMVAPFVGVLLGGMTALLVKATFKLLESSATSEPDWKVVGLLAAFAGFNWEWALEKIRYGAESVASRFTEKPGRSSDKNQGR